MSYEENPKPPLSSAGSTGQWAARHKHRATPEATRQGRTGCEEVRYGRTEQAAPAKLGSAAPIQKVASSTGGRTARPHGGGQGGELSHVLNETAPVNRTVPEAARLLGLHETWRGWNKWRPGNVSDPSCVSTPHLAQAAALRPRTTAEAGRHSRSCLETDTSPAHIFSQNQRRVSPWPQRCALSSVTASLSPHPVPSGKLRVEHLPAPTAQVRQAAGSCCQTGWGTGTCTLPPHAGPAGVPQACAPIQTQQRGWTRGAVGPSGVRPQAPDGKCQFPRAEAAPRGPAGRTEPGRPSCPTPGMPPPWAPQPPASTGTPPGTPLAGTHLLVHVGVNPLLALQPLGGHGAQLLLGALEPLQQCAVRVLAAAVVRRGPQPADRGL